MSELRPGHPTSEQLHAFSLGAIPPDDLEWVAAHLLTCGQCCESIDGLAAPDLMVVRLREATAPEYSSGETAPERESAIQALRRGRLRDAVSRRPPSPSDSTPPPGSRGRDPAAPLSAWRIADYEILGEVGRGGMGVVYKARHRGLNRLVALKMVLAGEFASQSDRLRFLREAELAAQVGHANIVQVHEIGNVQDRPYISMEWVEGGTLAERLDGTPWPPEEAALLIKTLAQAIDAAHRQGVIHRDLKPANILMQPRDQGDHSGARASSSTGRSQSSCTPKITDFGLARSLREQSGLTRTGLVVGTPEYMAPEQAMGNPALVGPAVDIYALGVILYQLLTGQPPFRGESPAAVLRASAAGPPVAPRRILKHVPRDLETITLKAIEKEPAHRYRTAADLSEDLRRYLAREPIRARPPWIGERLLKWARREPRLAALAASLVLVTVLALAGLTALWLKAATASRAAQHSRDLERRARYRADITAAAGALQLNRTETARRLLGSSPEEYRNWEWRYLRSQLDNSVARFDPGRTRPELVLLAPDCSRVIYASRRERVIHIREVSADREITVLSGHEGEVLAIALGAGGSRLASSSTDGTLRLWDVSTGRPLAVFRPEAGPIIRIDLSDDGSRLAAFTKGPDVQVWDVARGVPMSILKGAGEQEVVTLSPSGKWLAAGLQGRVDVWDVDSGLKRTPLSCGTARVLTLAFGPDGKRLAAGTDYPQNRVWLWDVAAGAVVATMDGHANSVFAVAFSPDGGRIVSTSQDQCVRLWDARSGQPLAVLRGHLNRVIAASFHPGGRYLASASVDGSLRLWDAQERAQIGVFRGEPQADRFAFSRPDGSRLATIGADAAVHLWDVERIKDDGVLGRHKSFVYDVAFSPLGRTVASCGWDGAVRLWDSQTGRSMGVLTHPSEIVTAVAFLPDGQRLASVSRDNRIHIWNVARREHTAQYDLSGGAYAEHRVAFASGGVLSASTGGEAGSVRLFTLSGGPPLLDLIERGSTTGDVAFSPDTTRLVSGQSDGTVRVWDVGRLALLAALRGHERAVLRVAYSARGRMIATASMDSTARLWDAKTLASLGVLKHSGVVFSVAFSPDESRLATGCDDNVIRLWDTETLDEVLELPGHGAYVHAVAFSPDGTMLASGSGDFTVRIWDTRSPFERRAMAVEKADK